MASYPSELKITGRRPFTLTIARKGLLLIALPLVAQFAFGAALLIVSRSAVEAHSWELHSQQVLSRAYGLKASLLVAQSNLRAYVLTEERAFRAECNEAEQGVPGEIAALSRLVADNPAQTGRVRRMVGTAGDFLRFQNENAELVAAGRREASITLIATQAGNHLLGRFLLPMNEFLAEEERLAKVRHDQASTSNRKANAVVAGGMLLNVLLAGVMAVAFTRSINRRLGVLTGNARRLAAEKPLLPPLSPGDEIAEVDRVFRDMAASLAKTTADLQQANREMEAFSYSVSHDLRTPLRAIDGFSRILLEEYGPHLDDEAKRFLGIIRGNTVTMAQLIDDLLAFSRLSRQPVARVQIDMNELVAQTFAEVAGTGGSRQMELVLGNLPPLRGDRAMIRQVLANLISNAVKFTAPRAAARIEVGSRTTGGENVYYVKDNGVGFDMRYADKLFGVFQRLHAASEFEGTGVGLAIVQRVIHRHGGRVWAESVPGEGATFYFTVGRDEGGEDG
jgi:two-component system sensor kinase